MKRIVITAILTFSLILPSFAQYNYAEEILKKQEVAETKKNFIKLDCGLGLGAAGKGGGLSGRLSAGFNIDDWGGTFRMIAANGKNGHYIGAFYSIPGYYLKEHFYENAVLVNHVLKNYKKSQLAVGVGFSSVRGNRLNEDGSKEIDFDKVYGLAYELTWASTGKIFGGSSQLYGNINKEAIFIGVSLCFSLGYWWE